MRAEDNVQCEVTMLPPQGIDLEMEKTLRKKSDWKTSEEEKWVQIYRLIFPFDKEIPEPCKCSS